MKFTHLIKSKNLYINFFEEEAITTLDNLIDTIISYIKFHDKLPTMNRNNAIENLCNTLCLNSRIEKDLKDLYKIRCRFTAHPAPTKWWDFIEIYEKDIDRIFSSVHNVVIKFYHYERKKEL